MESSNKNIYKPKQLALIAVDTSSGESPVLGYDVKTAIDYWNEIPELATHRPGTKLYQTIINSLERLFDGSLFEFDENGLQEYRRRKFTLNELKQSLDNFMISYRSTSHYPRDKSIYKNINFANWIYGLYKTGTKSLFIKYLDPPKPILAKSMVRIESEKMLDEFMKLHGEDLPPAAQDIVKKSMNRLLEIWKKMPKQITHTTMPGNLGQRQIVGLLLEFAQEITQYFSVKLLEQEWLWERFNGYLIEQGYLEG